MDSEQFYEEHKSNCPWHDSGQCIIQMYYGNHVNDRHYARCDINTCAVVYWLNLKDIQKTTPH